MISEFPSGEELDRAFKYAVWFSPKLSIFIRGASFAIDPNVNHYTFSADVHKAYSERQIIAITTLWLMERIGGVAGVDWYIEFDDVRSIKLKFYKEDLAMLFKLVMNFNE
ncbi:MAG: hypothetical protein HC836_16700 [Richelia sp. RM2_1_2]|nr:hypothetical protein [Richelia sp. RM2_1_2]